MALVIDPFNSGQASGKVGSQVASRNQSGPYIRRNAKPVNPKTPLQTLRRYAFTQLGNIFLNLSTTHIDEWNTFGATWPVQNRVGQSSFISGISWFKSLNSRLLAASYSIAYSPPLNPQGSFLPNVVVTQTGAGAILFSADVTIAAKQAIWWNASGNLPKSRRYISNGLRQLTLYKANTMPSAVTLKAASGLSFDDSSVQFTMIAVDENGRATAPVRYTVYPTS